MQSGQPGQPGQGTQPMMPPMAQGQYVQPMLQQGQYMPPMQPGQYGQPMPQMMQGPYMQQQNGPSHRGRFSLSRFSGMAKKALNGKLSCSNHQRIFD